MAPHRRCQLSSNVRPQNSNRLHSTAYEHNFCAIATVEQFKRALLSLRDKGLPDTHLTMLTAQGKAEGATITCTKLAEAAEYENYNAAALQYGTLAFNLGAFIDYTPPKRKDGTSMWWTVLSYSIDENAEPETGHFQFVMRPELLAALREMKWVRL